MFSPRSNKILVIRTGALGDLIFCLQSFQDIRRAHPSADIALLTRAPFAEFARAMPYFNRVIIDTHPRTLDHWKNFAGEVRAFAPERVYDLQGKTRQTILYTFLGGPFGPDWSGAAPFCKYPRLWPPGKKMRFTEFLAAQLRLANVPDSGKLDLTWLDAPTGKFILPQKYVVMIPGCSPGAVHKRWQPSDYAELVNQLRQQGIESILVGTSADAEAAAAIRQNAAFTVDLCGKTSLLELAGLFRKADGVVGNDTGPLHMAAAVGAPTLGLFSGRSSVDWSHPPGPRVTVLQKENLDDLDTGPVLDALQPLLQSAKHKS
jgi:ADP-heptose:LPS heptosyltransferase